jgi:CRISPR type IV-associated protein Csf2
MSSNEQTAAVSNYRFLAVLTTVSPLHITEPAADRITLDGKVMQGENGFPYARTTKMWLGGNPMVSDASEGASEAMKSVPCIPSNTIGGLLRRRAARQIFDHLVGRGEQLSINAYNVLECGAASGNPDRANPTVDEVVRGYRHPYFGVFGGGPRMLRRKLRVDTALAITEASVPYLHTHFGNALSTGRLTGVLWQRRNDDLLHVVDPITQQLTIANYLEGVNAYQDDKMANKAKVADDEKAPRGLDTFNALEHVAPGVHFALRLDLTEATQAQAGLLLSSLLALVELNRIGGQGRRGFGRFLLQSFVAECDGEQKLLASRISETDLAVSAFGQELMREWERERSTLSAGEFEAYAKSMDVVTEKPKGKAGSKKGSEVEAQA